MIDDKAFFSDQHLMEEPLRIAVQNLCYLRPKVMTGFAESVNDFAEVGFINAQHFRQAVLSYPAGEHPQLEIWVDVTIYWHFLLPNVCISRHRPSGNGTLMPRTNAIDVPNLGKFCRQHFVELPQFSHHRKHS
jgi:hypothetical protein